MSGPVDLALGIGVGAAAGILGDKIEDWLEGDTFEARSLRAQAQQLALLHSIATDMRQLAQPAPTARDTPINVLPGARLSLNSDRAHVSFFSLVAVQLAISSDAGNETVTLGVGWSTVDRPQGSWISLLTGSGTSVQVIRRDADVGYGTVV